MSDNGTEPEVWAAGGVVEDDEGRLLVVHRPRYDDWSRSTAVAPRMRAAMCTPSA